MRVAVVAGPEAGHAFPAIALCLKLAAAGDEPVLLTGVAVAYFRGVAEQEAWALEQAGRTDPLTGLGNRRALFETFGARQSGAAGRTGLVMLDIDHFKTVNDSFGHQAGDHVLIEVASRLRRSLRGNDMVARWGGEEFVVLLRDCALPDALTLAEGICAEIAEVPEHIRGFGHVKERQVEKAEKLRAELLRRWAKPGIAATVTTA
jgi:diguanylate cyclase (GGDEF)-like protein